MYHYYVSVCMHYCRCMYWSACVLYCVCVCMYYCTCVCVHVLLCLCMYVLLCVCLLLHVCVRVLLCMCVVHSVRARALSPPPACAVCVGVPVLVYCIHVVGIVVVIGSPCRTCVVCSVVCVSTMSLGCVCIVVDVCCC